MSATSTQSVVATLPPDPLSVPVHAEREARAESRTNLYLATFALLFVLTAIEVGIAMAGVNRSVLVTALIGLAFLKVSAIAAVFMHLWWEQRWVGLIAFTPLPLLVMFVMAMLHENGH